MLHCLMKCISETALLQYLVLPGQAEYCMLWQPVIEVSSSSPACTLTWQPAVSIDNACTCVPLEPAHCCDLLPASMAYNMVAGFCAFVCCQCCVRCAL